MHFSDATDAAEALKTFNGRAVNGRELRIEYAKKRASQKERRGKRVVPAEATEEEQPNPTADAAVSDATATNAEPKSAAKDSEQQTSRKAVEKAPDAGVRDFFFYLDYFGRCVISND